ncbi:MAG TPA: hypothetical protein VMU24_01110, partial [Candidatus Acidoferrales bacterium]|nr:hypothetical protein [Candidatus Acidoferrales bacterium]
MAARKLYPRISHALLLCALLILALCGIATAQPGSPAPETEQEEAPVTIFPHSDTAPWWVSGQVNVIFQAHGDFPAKYSGPNSFQNSGQSATSRVLTLYLGFQPVKGQEFLLDVEEAGGHGLSDALGLAGFTNLDVVRNPSLG